MQLRGGPIINVEIIIFIESVAGSIGRNKNGNLMSGSLMLLIDSFHVKTVAQLLIQLFIQGRNNAIFQVHLIEFGKVAVTVLIISFVTSGGE